MTPYGLAKLLRDQPGLEELTPGGGAMGLEDLQSTDVSNLRSFQVYLKEAALLVPGCPIAKLRLLPESQPQYYDETFFSKLFHLTERITDFSYCLHPMAPESTRHQIQLIAQNVPYVERLTVTVNGRISSQILLQEIPSLHSLRRLTFLDAELAGSEDLIEEMTEKLKCSHTLDLDLHTEKSWSSFFEELRSGCPELVNADYTPVVRTCCFEPYL
ncbi:hypothetical protein FRB90_007004 [Tulasnella sp. 427]|nr:hypothetical protein FRB90_007004 [Tulasnella sp. 427]